MLTLWSFKRHHCTNTYLFTVKKTILRRYMADGLFFLDPHFFGPTCKRHPFLKRETFPNNLVFTLLHINFLVYWLKIQRKTLTGLFGKKDDYFSMEHLIFSNPISRRLTWKHLLDFPFHNSTLTFHIVLEKRNPYHGTTLSRWIFRLIEVLLYLNRFQLTNPTLA